VAGTIHHLAMVATEELPRHEVVSAVYGRSCQGSHRGQTMEEEKFCGRNDPPSGDGGYRRSGRLSSRANPIRSTLWRWWLPQVTPIVSLQRLQTSHHGSTFKSTLVSFG
jgi:hypothetical protein